MKKSNLILFGALGAILIFTLAFQLTTHRYIKEDNRKRATATRVTEERTITPFKGISTMAPIKIVLVQDSLQKIQIEAPSYLIDSVKTYVANDTLSIETPNDIRKRDSVKVHITLKTLEHLQLGSYSIIESKDTIAGNELNLQLKGHSAAQLLLKYEHMNYSNTSDGLVDIAGDIKNIKIVNVQKE
ncbi:GIN domain-containing protein [Flagellimonas sp.]|uniref:GIN domain-containing protein n=1 Tax=Flagellimonas sp. TaxID=2058762 RepID=UPI003F4A7D57